MVLESAEGFPVCDVGRGEEHRMGRIIRLNLNETPEAQAKQRPAQRAPVKLSDDEIVHIWEGLFGRSGRYRNDQLKRAVAEVMSTSTTTSNPALALTAGLRSGKLGLEQYEEILRAFANAQKWPLRRKRLLFGGKAISRALVSALLGQGGR